MKEAEQIEEILTEANAYGMRDKVERWAKMSFGFLNDIDEVEAYQIAFDKMVTNSFKTIVTNEE